MSQIQLKVEGMTCGGCIKSIRNALGEHNGIQETSADLDSSTVTIDFDDNLIQVAAIKNAIEAAGFDVTS